MRDQGCQGHGRLGRLRQMVRDGDDGPGRELGAVAELPRQRQRARLQDLQSEIRLQARRRQRDLPRPGDVLQDFVSRTIAMVSDPEGLTPSNTLQLSAHRYASTAAAPNAVRAV